MCIRDRDKTIINGGNITTGQIHNLNYTTVYDLDNAWIRMGTEAGERVFLDNRHIAWYATINTGSIGLTGVLYSEAGSSYIGACSKYARYGLSLIHISFCPHQSGSECSAPYWSLERIHR